jgi:hypothetical protein
MNFFYNVKITYLLLSNTEIIGCLQAAIAENSTIVEKGN